MPTGDVIRTREMAALQVLDACRAGIVDLTGIGHAVHLAGLDLGHKDIDDLRPLGALSRLVSLNLDGTAHELWTVASLSGLRRLSLRGNGLDDLVALSTLTNLVWLDVGDNRIGDLHPLSALAALAELAADGNAIRDLAPLADLPLRRLALALSN